MFPRVHHWSLASFAAFAGLAPATTALGLVDDDSRDEIERFGPMLGLSLVNMLGPGLGLSEGANEG